MSTDNSTTNNYGSAEAHFTEGDRKTLTVLETKLDRVIDDVAAISSNFASQLEVTDHETRLRAQQIQIDTVKTKVSNILTEAKTWATAIGIIATVSGTALGILIEHFIK